MGRREFPRERKLQRMGTSVGSTLPKDKLREHGLLDENDNPRKDIGVRAYEDDERGVIGLEVPVKD